MKTTNTALKIRRAKLFDAAAVTDLLRESFREYRPLYTEKGFLATTPSAAEIEVRISQKAVWVILLNDRIAGTVSLYPRGEELFVRSMAVHPAAQGKGVGRVLLGHAQEMAYSTGCSALTLTTTPFLSKAIGLYENVGFRPEGNADLYGTPLIKMRKELLLAKSNKIENNDYAI